MKRSMLTPVIISPALKALLKWVLLGSVIGLLAGTASAAFLFSLDWVTSYREAHPWIIVFLPLAGLLSGWIYHGIGSTVESGNNLLIDEIHQPKRTVPLRMTPLVLGGSLLTHLSGGSAGREGTAIQMGGSLADQFAHLLGLGAEDRRVILMAGISAGFASVFGTPLAGTVFGFEVLAIGRASYDAIFPCLVAALVGHETTLAWGIHHSVYKIAVYTPLVGRWLVYAAAAGMIFGLTGLLFSESVHRTQEISKRWMAYPPLRPFVGGAIVAGIVLASGSTRYCGLGLPVIRDSFGMLLPSWDFAAKAALTILTLGSGFKGGEVTPLFFIGSTLGNALSRIIPLPTPLLAGMGFAAVFAGAANTPLACTLMAVELFGGNSVVYMGIACIVSYLFSGHAGIYRSQRLHRPKHPNL